MKINKMALFGTVSNMIKESTDEGILSELGANNYKGAVKKLLIERIRASDEKLTIIKDTYGLGYSVKGILVNVSGFHFLKRINLIRENGKNWDDEHSQKPTVNVDPLENCTFFHGKTGYSIVGCRAGFTFEVLDKNDVKMGVISVAWENPYYGKFTYCCIVSKHEDNLQLCLDHCNHSGESKIIGDVSIAINDEMIKKFISVNMSDDKSTSYIVIGVKTSDMVKAVYGELEE